MKICMLGSGALGSALGGVLTEAGNDVWLIDAWAGHVDAMNSRGLTLYAWDGVKAMPQGRNWLALPDGLCVEVIQATGDSVAAVLAVDPRA